MDVPVSQAWALEVSAADPWHFTEEITFGDGADEYRYLMRWKVDGHYLAALSAIAVEAPGQVPADAVPADAASDFDVTVKWDGCCDWRFSPDDGHAAAGYSRRASEWRSSARSAPPATARAGPAVVGGESKRKREMMRG